MCNLLTRRQPEEVAQLGELSELLRAAQLNLSGDQLRELGRQRNQLVAALARQARALASAEGQPVSSAVAEQVEGTLRAAVADPDAGAALRAGRLTTALSYSGLGPVDLSGAVATPVRSPVPARTPGTAGGHVEAEEQRRREAAEQARRELEQARRDAEEAAAVARDAEAAATTAEDEVTAAGERRDERQQRVDRLERELRRARREAEESAAAVSEAELRRDSAVRRAATAAAIRDRAAARVHELADAVED